MSLHRRKGSPFWHYDFWRGGRRFCGTTGTADRRAAERVEREAQRQAAADLAAGRHNSAPATMTWGVAAARYWQERGQHGTSSREAWRALEWLTDRIGNALPLTAITPALVADLVRQRRAEKVGGKRTPPRPVSPATINRSVVEPLRRVLGRARKAWRVEAPEIEWGDYLEPEAVERVREASADEEARLFAALRPDYRPIVRFALVSGQRKAACLGLRWSDVDLAGGRVTFAKKGGGKHTIPVSAAMRQILLAERGHDFRHVWTYVVHRTHRGDATGSRKPMTLGGLNNEWRRARKAAGVEDFRFHDWRHTAATRLVRAKGNLKLAQRLLGHATLSTTGRYAHTTEADLLAGMDAASPVKNPVSVGGVWRKGEENQACVMGRVQLGRLLLYH